MPKIINVIGKKFNRLTVIERAYRPYPGTFFRCRCDCGNETIVVSQKLRFGSTKSCGCFKGDQGRKRFLKHGQHNIPEYQIWQAIKTRCYNFSSIGFKYYGARGINVCNRWKHSFANFFADMGERPTPQHTIERRNNNKGYSPNNCYWATRKSQNRNKRSNCMLTFRGQTKCLSEWVEELDLNYDMVKQRINKLGWSVEEAFTTPALQ